MNTRTNGIIYALLDPRKIIKGFNHSCFYIGIIYSSSDKRLKKRLSEHVYDSKNKREKNIKKELEYHKMTLKELKKYKQNIAKEKHEKKHKELYGENYSTNYASKRRKSMRENIGDIEYKKIIAKKKRDWYSSLTEEAKIIQRKKDSEYRKRKRVEKKAGLKSE